LVGDVVVHVNSVHLLFTLLLRTLGTKLLHVFVSSVAIVVYSWEAGFLVSKLIYKSTVYIVWRVALLLLASALSIHHIPIVTDTLN